MRQKGITDPQAYFASYDFDKLPTFYEFVQHLINCPVEDYNAHWQPITALCPLCQEDFHYQFILKVHSAPLWNLTVFLDTFAMVISYT